MLLGMIEGLEYEKIKKYYETPSKFYEISLVGWVPLEFTFNNQNVLNILKIGSSIAHQFVSIYGKDFKIDFKLVYNFDGSIILKISTLEKDNLIHPYEDVEKSNDSNPGKDEDHSNL